MKQFKVTLKDSEEITYIVKVWAEGVTDAMDKAKKDIELDDATVLKVTET